MTATKKLSARLGFGALLMMTGMALPLSAQAAEIIVYADAYYSGASRHYSGDVRDFANEGFNDRISSIRVVSGFWTVCTDANFYGRCQNVSGDISNLESTGLNDRISSIRLESGGGGSGGWGQGSYRDGIVLYDDTNYRGREVAIDEDAPNLGQYSFNDRATSLRVEGGTWEICQDGNYGGRCQIVDGDVASLSTFNMNNTISSVRRVGGGDHDGDWGDWWSRDRNTRWDDWENNSQSRASVYEHTGYRGERRDFNGAVPDLTRMGFNDRISSFRLDGRWQFCEHVNYGGECEIFRYDEDNLVPSGWNDRISSMRPIAAATGNSALVLFEDVNFGGDRERVREDVPDLRARGFNNIASSMRVRRGSWEVCEDVNYRGRCRIFDANENNLAPLGLNDRISSVRRTDNVPGGPGGHGGQGNYDGITIFEHTNFGGRSEHFTNDVPNLTPHNFNDALSSFRIQDGRWELCEDAYYQGRCWTFDGDVGNVVPLGFNDRISSMRRLGGGHGGWPGGGQGYNAQIEVFEHANYGGRSRTYTSTVSNLVSDGWNDTISSFRVSGPGRWEICEHVSFGGRCQIFTSDEPTLVPLNWNDRVSSIRYLP